MRGGCGAAGPRADHLTVGRAGERGLEIRHLGRIGSRALHRVMQPLLGLTRPRDVDLLRELGRVREHRHEVVEHLEDAAAHRDVVVGALRPVAELARAESREEVHVLGQDAELAEDAGRIDLLDVGIEELPIGRDEKKSHEVRNPGRQAARRFAAAIASSIVPTM